MEKPSSAKSNKSAKDKAATAGQDKSAPKSAGAGKALKKSPSPQRKLKPITPGRKSAASGELKSAMKKGNGKDKSKKKTMVKSPDMTKDGLRIIDMSGQGMTVLPLSVLTATDIGELCLASNNLRSLPIEIKSLTTLRKLDLSKNGVRCTNPNDFSGLPADIKELVNLQELKISECNLPHIPPAIWTLVHLKILDISRNKINTLQPEVGNLINLQKLNLQQTNINTLPPEIAYCQELEEIFLWGNVIESLPETLPEMLKLRTLAVNYRSFCAQVDAFQESEELLRKGKMTSEHIPLVVFELATLEVLDLENTKINNIPDMSNISLLELYLCKNFLSKVPLSLFNLHHLTILDMSYNLLTYLPDDISRVKSLIILRMSNNQIERIPNKISELTNLEELNLANNKIRFMPTQIGGLGKLKSLFVEKNELSCLPDELCELENLETLDITENRITALPMQMHKLKKLVAAHSYHRLSKYGLWLYKNPIHTPPPEIWKTEHPEKIFEYLKKLAILKTENLQRQKMLMFGSSASGKTSLVNALVHRKSMMTNGPADQTRAVQVTPWKTESNVEFMLHDFCGDRAYTMIYPMFADANALVLIIYDHSSYTTKMHYSVVGQWIAFLQMYMPGIVVKLVGTHLDKFQEHAIKDENGNQTDVNERQCESSEQNSRTPSSRSSHSALQSRLSSSSARSVKSPAGSNKDESVPTLNLDFKDTGTSSQDFSRASTFVSQSQSVAELVKMNTEKQMQEFNETLETVLDNLTKEISLANEMDRDPQYIKHLQIQQKKVEHLKGNKLRIVPDISLISNNEGLEGVNAFIESLELMVINKSLFPHAQRSIPKTWNELKVTLKQHNGYYISWKTIEQSAKDKDVKKEELRNCLQYLNDTGEILWFNDQMSLSKIIFHKPRVLINVLAAMFRHDMETFLNFENNKVFISKGMFSENDFQTAKEMFLRNGQISRPLMNCFWFFEELDQDQFNDLVDLVPKLDVCYSIPEPSIPKGKLYSYPIIVLPWYNQDKAGVDFTEHWNDEMSKLTNPNKMEVSYILPVGLPSGLFEKLVSVLQTHVTTRIDWKDTVFATTENEIIKICLLQDGNASLSLENGEWTIKQTESHISITVAGRSDDMTETQNLLKELIREVTTLLNSVPGLVWYIKASDNLWHSSVLQYIMDVQQFKSTRK